MAEHILITGGSGLIGTALTTALLRHGHRVSHLGRKSGMRGTVTTHAWDLHRGSMDPAAVAGVDHIVHLAGAGIADERWTNSRVEELIDSRTLGASLLLDTCRREGITPRSFISAAGINYYGAETSDHIYRETDAPGTDTIGRISVAWEAAVDQWAEHCRVVKLRTPIVLSAHGGALPKLATPVRWWMGAALGSGAQWMPWVHMNDLISAYEHALFNEQLHGAYNVCAPEHATNVLMMRTVAKVLGKPMFLPPVPGFLLRLALGEMASLLLAGSRAANDRLLATGYRFEHPTLEDALRDLLSPSGR